MRVASLNASLPLTAALRACARSGAGYSITNTFISNGRGNGAIVRGNSGNIQTNNISYVALNSFTFAPGFDATHEGGFSQSLTVRAQLLSSLRLNHPFAGRLTCKLL
jgi:hypothetical protein